MSAPTIETIVGYLYRDEHYCRGCIVEAVASGSKRDERDEPERWLIELAAIWGHDRGCPASFSQHDFPHTITSGQLDEPVRCDTCMEEIR